MKPAILLFGALTFAVAFAEDAKPPEVTAEHYRVYRGDGTPTTLAQAIVESRAAAVTFLGESHDDPVAHHLELEILKGAHRPELALSLEMFERDVQYVLDEYLAGKITEEHLLKSGRAWNNYKSDYKPMVEFAKEQKMAVLAANAPRRYVNRVTRLGAASLAELSPEAKRSLPPLPYGTASPEYRDKFVKIMEEHRPDDKDAKNPPRPRDYTKSVESQSLWDAGMAYSIAEFLLRHPGSNVLHVNGSFHSAQHLGILEHLARYSPRTSTLVITMVSEKSFPDFDAAAMRGQGDFVIVTDPSLPRSYKD